MGVGWGRLSKEGMTGDEKRKRAARGLKRGRGSWRGRGGQTKGGGKELEAVGNYLGRCKWLSNRRVWNENWRTTATEGCINTAHSTNGRSYHTEGLHACDTCSHHIGLWVDRYYRDMFLYSDVRKRV